MQRAPRRGAVTIFHGRDIIYQSRALADQTCKPRSMMLHTILGEDGYWLQMLTRTFSQSKIQLEQFRKEQRYINLHVREDLCGKASKF